MIIVCKKTWNAYETSLRWSSKDEVKKQTMARSTKQSLQGSDHNAHSHLEWTLEQTSKQAQCKSLACSTLNQCTIH